MHGQDQSSTGTRTVDESRGFSLALGVGSRWCRTTGHSGLVQSPWGHERLVDGTRFVGKYLEC